MKHFIASRFELAQYCLRKLGAPVIKINVTEQQIDDRINDALDMFLQFHMDGSYREIIAHEVTQEDINLKKIILPYNILSVLSVHFKTDASSTSMSNPGNLQMQTYFSDLIKSTYAGAFSSSSLSNYVVAQSWLGVMGTLLPNGLTRVTTYKLYQNELIIPDMNWGKIEPGFLVGLECYVYNDPDAHGTVFNDHWLKQYATALIKLQWGNNIGKYNGIPLPGGGQLNGEAIIAQAQQEVSDLELKLRDNFSMPILPFMA